MLAAGDGDAETDDQKQSVAADTSVLGLWGEKRFIPAPGWPEPPPGWVPPWGWRPDPSWPPAPPGHRWWGRPKRTWGQRVALLGVACAGGAVVLSFMLGALLAAGWYLEEYGDPIYGHNACNDRWGGNDYIEDAIIDDIPEGFLRGYLDIGPDCDDRRTGSVGAAWSSTARPASVVDQLVRQGWTRTDPPGGVPAWYSANEPAADPRWSCLTPTGGPWHPLKRKSIRASRAAVARRNRSCSPPNVARACSSPASGRADLLSTPPTSETKKGWRRSAEPLSPATTDPSGFPDCRTWVATPRWRDGAGRASARADRTIGSRRRIGRLAHRRRRDGRSRRGSAVRPGATADESRLRLAETSMPLSSPS